MLLMFLAAFSWQCKSPVERGQPQVISIEDSFALETQFDEAWKMRKRDLDSAFLMVRALERKTAELEYQPGISRCYRYLGLFHNYQAHYDSARFYYKQSEQVSRSIRDLNGLYSTYDKLGVLEQGEGNFIKADSFFRQSLTIAKIIQDSVDIARANSRLGAVYKRTSDYLTALDYYEKALNIRSAINDEKGIETSYFNFGTVYAEMGQYDKAAEIYHQILPKAVEEENQITISRTCYNLGTVFYEWGEFDSAALYLSRALGIRESRNNLMGLITGYYMMGNIMLQKEQLDSAQFYFRRSANIAEEIDTPKERNLPWLGLGRVKLAQNNLDSAAFYLDSCLAWSLQLKDLGTSSAAHYYQVIIHHRRADSKRLENSLAQYDSLEAVINREAVGQSLSEITNIKEFNKQRAKEQKQKFQLYQATQREKWFKIGLAGVILILILLSISFLLYRRNQAARLAIQQQEFEKQAQNHQLEMTQSMIKGQDEERKRVASELHDSVGALLATVKLQYAELKQEVTEVRTEQHEKFESLEQLISDAVEEVRRISHNMVSGLLMQFGLRAALKNLCETLGEAGSLEVNLVLVGLEERLDTDLEIQTYRIVQELATNCLKHAKASRFEIKVLRTKGELKIITKDDGRGFSPQQVKRGLGLSNIENRIKIFEGDLQVESTAGKGVKTVITIPLKSNLSSN